MTPAEALATVEALAPRLPPELAPLFSDRFIRSCALYEEFVLRLAVRVLRETGLEAAAREPGAAAELVARAGLAAPRALVPVDWILRHLAAHGLLDAPAGSSGGLRFRLPATLPDLDPALVRDAQRAWDPSWLPSYALAEAAAASYPAFLRGEMTGEDVLASPARLRLWADYFSNDNGLYAVNNEVGARAVLAWMPPGASAVLELGGGLASAAVALLERLELAERLGAVRQYRFTELVPALLGRGQRALQARFPAAGWLTCARLDMNAPFGDQEVAPGAFSLVYAVNTLHVAHDLDFTLAEIFCALQPGGRVVLSECVRPHPARTIYVEFVFNLLETFRAPRLHPTYRPNGGFLTPEQWTAALLAAGFDDVRLLPDVTRLRDTFPSFYVAAIGATRRA
jgi:SAM-dependent methyltransferase